MTVGEWLHSRPSQPPDALARRIDAVIGARGASPESETADVCLAAAERLVGELLRSRSTSRDSALDLLTADALVTYAFEAASSEPSTIDARAAAAMERILALVAAEQSA